MPNFFFEAPEVREIADRLIPEHHSHLAGVRIEYLFRTKAAKHGGKVALGSARIISGLNAYLATDPDDDEEFELTNDETEGPRFFVIEIWSEGWKKLNEAQRIALVDHELCHCWREEAFNQAGLEVEVFSTLAHDVEEFASIVNRHGLWRPDLSAFVEAGSKKLQDPLPWEAPAPPAPPNPNPAREALEASIRTAQYTDESYREAVSFVRDRGQASTSMLQRRLNIGFATASAILDRMETEGVVGPRDGPRPRVVIDPEDNPGGEAA